MPDTLTKSLYDRAAIIPGRSMTRSKAGFKRWADYGAGAMLFDADGNKYIDMVCGLGAISLGYQSNREFSDYVQHGVYSLPHALEVEAAEAVLTHVAPWASSVRFVKTGSEATHAAYRIAKKATGRDHILMGDWAYHGWHEWCSRDMWPLGDVNGRCDFKFKHGQQLYAPFPDEVAAVFIEPHRWKPVDVDWLRSVRAFCDRVGALLVFDSMLWGGRYALGGASEYYGVIPDLECFGKAFGNGEAVAFVVGREALAEHGEIVSGTFSGDVTGLSAVCEVLQRYTTEPVIETLWARGKQLHAGLSQVLPASFATLTAPTPLVGITFTNPAHKAAFSEAMAQRGVLVYPDWWMVMAAHTEAQINQVIEAAEASCRMLN